MRVADHDFTTRRDVCFNNNWEATTLSGGIRVCRLNPSLPGSSSSCFPTMEYSIPIQGFSYSRVCGRIIGYQLGSLEAFVTLVILSRSIDAHYVDGLSLTHGSPRQHIWSFAVGPTHTTTDNTGCPCNYDASVTMARTFVGDDYFCDSAASSISPGLSFPGNPLWDGTGCELNNQGCCSFNDPPWFYKELPQPTSDNIELRSCRDENGFGENILIGAVEIYVQ